MISENVTISAPPENVLCELNVIVQEKINLDLVKG